MFGGSSGAFAGEDAALAGDRSAVTVAGFFGAGADILLGRRWSLGVNAGYTWMADVGEPIGGRFGYSGFDAAVSIGWMWGRGYE